MPQVNFIGQYPFISMSMSPIGNKQTPEVESRPGVDGLFIWLTGTRAEPFELQTIVDVNNVASAATLLALYEEMVGTLQTLIFANVPYPNYFCVLNVQPIPEQTRQILLGIGGTSSENSYGLLGANWTLVATDQEAG